MAGQILGAIVRRKTPVATNCRVLPLAMLGSAGVTSIADFQGKWPWSRSRRRCRMMHLEAFADIGRSASRCGECDAAGVDICYCGTSMTTMLAS